MLSRKSIKYLNDYFEKTDDPYNKSDYKRLPIESEKIDDIVYELGLDKNNLQIVRLEETSEPKGVPPHADGIDGQLTIIVPLKFEEKIQTILFKAYYMGDNYQRGFKYRPSGISYYDNEWFSDDYHQLHGLTDKPFNDNQYSKILSFIDEKDLYGLEVDYCEKWEVGKVIKFKSNQLHCGCSFNKSKRWLFILTKRKIK